MLWIASSKVAMLVSPRSASTTIRTSSSPEYLFRVTRRSVRTVASALSFFSAILPPFHYTRVEECVLPNGS